MNNTRQSPPLGKALALLVSALLAACGGANDTSTDATNAEGPAQTTTTTADAPPGLAQDLAVRGGSGSAAAAVTAAVADIPGGPGVYVDSALGNDSNPGTQALPWKTLGKLVAARLSSGQGIYLHCGATWRESVTLNGTQLADGAVVSGYGACATAKATVTGADDFSTGWIKVGSIWQRPVPLLTPKIARLFVNGIPQRTAQWPNHGGIGKEYALARADMVKSSSVLAVSSTDLAAVATQDLVGATVLVKTEPWLMEQRAVTAATAAGNLTLGAPTAYGIEGGDGYILQDKLWMLNSAGQFFHDTAKGMLYLWPSDAAAQLNLNTSKVEGSVRDIGLQLRSRSGLQVRYLAFTRAKADGLLLVDTPNAVIDTVAVDDNVTRGLRLASSSASLPSAAGTTVRNSSFSRNGLNAIEASSVSNITLSSNVFSDTGMPPNAGNAQAAIVIGPSGFAEKNTIRRSAQAGIRFSGTGGTRVMNNLVEDACLRFSDCAGMMTWNGSKNLVNHASLLEANTIIRVLGNAEGSVGGASDWAAGIYLDEFTNGATLRNNLVVGTGMGITVHNASNITVEYNRVALASKASLFATMDHTDADYMTNNVFRFNQWVSPGTSSGTFPTLPTASAPPAVMFWHTLHGSAAIGAGKNYFTNNEFVLPNGTSVPSIDVRGNGTAALLTAQDWIRSNPLDSVNASTPRYATSQLNMGPNLIPQGGFDAGLGTWFAYTAPATPRGAIVAGPHPGCTATCAIMASGSVSDSINSPPFNMAAGGLYYLSYLAAFTNDGTISRPGIGRAALPHDTFMASRISTSASKGISGSVLGQETYFTASSSESAYLTLGAAAGTQVAFDNVSLRQVFGYTLAKVPEWVSYAYASPLTAATVDCPTLGWPAGCTVTDLSGRAVPLPTSLPAGTAAVYLRSDSAWRAQ